KDPTDLPPPHGACLTGAERSTITTSTQCVSPGRSDATNVWVRHAPVSARWRPAAASGAHRTRQHGGTNSPTSRAAHGSARAAARASAAEWHPAFALGRWATAFDAR